MGFADSYLKMAQAEYYEGQTERDKAQLEFERQKLDAEMQSKGYEYDSASKSWQQGPTLKSQQDTALMQLQLQQQQLQQQLTYMTQQQNVTSLNNMLDSALAGDPQAAINEFKSNKFLNQAFANSSLGIKDLRVLNTDTDQNLISQKGIDLMTLGISDTSRLTPQQRKSLQSMMFVGNTNDGEKVITLRDLIGPTQYLQKASTQRLKQIEQGMHNFRNAFMSIEDEYKAALGQQAKATAAATNMQTNDAMVWLEKNPTKTYQDYLALSHPKQQEKGMSWGEYSSMLNVQDKLTANALKGYTVGNRQQFLSDLSSKSVGDTVNLNGTQIPLYEAAKIDQGDKKLDATQKNYLDGLNDTSIAFKNLYNKLDSANFDWNAAAKAMSEVSKVLGTSWSSVTPEQKESMLKRVEFDAELHTAMASYIKTMSGAAVSDEERKFYNNAMIAGNWANRDAAKASLSGFIRGIDSSLVNKVNSLKSELPATYLDYKGSLNISQPETKTITKQEAQPKIYVDTDTGKKYKYIGDGKSNTQADWEEIK